MSLLLVLFERGFAGGGAGKGIAGINILSILIRRVESLQTVARRIRSLLLVQRMSWVSSSEYCTSYYHWNVIFCSALIFLIRKIRWTSIFPFTRKNSFIVSPRLLHQAVPLAIITFADWWGFRVVFLASEVESLLLIMCTTATVPTMNSIISNLSLFSTDLKSTVTMIDMSKVCLLRWYVPEILQTFLCRSQAWTGFVLPLLRTTLCKILEERRSRLLRILSSSLDEIEKKFFLCHFRNRMFHVWVKSESGVSTGVFRNRTQHKCWFSFLFPNNVCLMLLWDLYCDDTKIFLLVFAQRDVYINLLFGGRTTEHSNSTLMASPLHLLFDDLSQRCILRLRPFSVRTFSLLA